ncbi:unnamed protein product [Clavelina lepadiformis]|uniref:Protein N-terminal asparagine amidohydrolase n=1 Tax=Clavelina lepadiformis TaxID=159417 RepID=A0ABP0FN86_CLALP
MPLFIGEDVVETESLETFDLFLKNYEKCFEESNNQLREAHETRITPSNSCLYVSQREFATSPSNNDVISAIGTDMMTTCHAVVLRCNKSKVTSLGHFDGCATEQGVKDMIDSVINASKYLLQDSIDYMFDLHLIGGFEDERNLSEKLTLNLLSEFHSSKVAEHLPMQFHLKTFCCTTLNQKLISHNDMFIKSPVIFGICVTLATGDLFPCVFDEEAKGPVPALRSARSLHGPHNMTSIYRWKLKEIILEPFTYKPFAEVSLWLQQPDDIIRQYMSTSPEVEPDNFCDHIRATLQFIADNPDPVETVFKDNKPLKYQKKGEAWAQIRSS